jgi:hypothetical protein
VLVLVGERDQAIVAAGHAALPSSTVKLFVRRPGLRGLEDPCQAPLQFVG